MKIILEKREYSFSPLDKKIIFFRPIDLAHIGIITNVTAGVMIFQMNDAANNGTFTNNELTLDYNTTSMSSSDDLQIIVDVPDVNLGNYLQTLIAQNNDIIGLLTDIRDRR